MRNLKQILHSQMSGHIDSSLVVEQINLLERISPILGAESSYPERQPSVLSSSVLKALLYCTQHYYGAPENLLHSPAAIRKMHSLSERQVIWVSVRGRATAEAWKDCENLLGKILTQPLPSFSICIVYYWFLRFMFHDSSFLYHVRYILLN